MIRATVGTCNGCGLGVSLPYNNEFKPGERVVVLSQKEFEQVSSWLAYAKQAAEEKMYSTLHGKN